MAKFFLVYYRWIFSFNLSFELFQPEIQKDSDEYVEEENSSEKVNINKLSYYFII